MEAREGRRQREEDGTEARPSVVRYTVGFTAITQNTQHESLFDHCARVSACLQNWENCRTGSQLVVFPLSMAPLNIQMIKVDVLA
ncbi:hypothetical protein EV1_016288 [Malus domestica]